MGKGAVGFRLNVIFGDDMVLQRDVPVPVWGEAPAGETVEVSLDGVSAGARADEAGRWKIELPAGPAGGPYTLKARCGAAELRCERVWRGEVWLAGGQSNMEMTLTGSDNGDAAVRESLDPRLHFYHPAKAATVEEVEEIEGGGGHPRWRVSGPDTAGDLSAVAYYAGRTLTSRLPDVHVGLLVCCWGGTYAHCWMPEEELRTFPEGIRCVEEFDARVGGKSDREFLREQAAYQRELDIWNGRVAARRAAEPDVSREVLEKDCGPYPWPPPMGRRGFQYPGNLYRSMLSRMAPYAIRGFWYYQGETDEEWPERYRALLEHLIYRWRKDWGGEEKPFLLVQLPMYISKAEHAVGDSMRWPVLREAQADAAGSIPGVEMVVTADCGEFDNVHPTDKRTPGTRLGLLALESVYRLPVTGRPPVCVDARREDGAAVLRFDRVGGGLYLAGEGLGFRLAGEDGVFRDASAHVTAPDTVRVTAGGIDVPTAVSYARYSFGQAQLYGGTGLAAAPLEIVF